MQSARIRYSNCSNAPLAVMVGALRYRGNTPYDLNSQLSTKLEAVTDAEVETGVLETVAAIDNAAQRHRVI
jgi:hypothetical protein